MNLRKLFKWNKSEELKTTALATPEITQNNSNMVSLPLTEINIEEKDNPLDSSLALKPKLSPIKGLMNAEEITTFFNENYFGLGRHNGSNFRTQEALDLGKRSLISKFQNTLADLLESKQARINKLQNQLVAIEGISASMTQQLKLACEHVEREINVLQDQIESAGNQKGWVLEALNRYQIGYMRGLNEAIEFEFLAG
jgi:hypothetical protein